MIVARLWEEGAAPKPVMAAGAELAQNSELEPGPDTRNWGICVPFRNTDVHILGI